MIGRGEPAAYTLRVETQHAASLLPSILNSLIETITPVLNLRDDRQTEVLLSIKPQFAVDTIPV